MKKDVASQNLKHESQNREQIARAHHAQESHVTRDEQSVQPTQLVHYAIIGILHHSYTTLVVGATCRGIRAKYAQVF